MPSVIGQQVSPSIAATRTKPEQLSRTLPHAWTEDGLLRQVVYEGIREDKPAREVVRR